ncbi:MAG: TolC family protein [Sphingopyxis sp.]|nr:TolC family protein [Sphingopyxis sp.]
MKYIFAAASLAAFVAAGYGVPAAAQARDATVVGPPSSTSEAVRTGPLPARLTLAQAMEEADARSPRVVAAAAEVEAARGRQRQSRYRFNPTLNVDVQNFAGTGPYTGFNGLETTVLVSQRIDVGGRRRARMTLADAELIAAQYRLEIARADLALDVRNQFATASAARDSLTLARENEARARELVRVAQAMVDTGNEPPLRAFRANAALVQATAELRTAEAEEQTSRRSLAALLGATTPPVELVAGDAGLVTPASADALETLDVRLAETDKVIAEARLRGQRADGRLDPSLGVGMRQLRATGDRAFVANLSVPLPIFDRNQGNVAAAKSDVAAAIARRENAVVNAQAQIANAQAELEAADARLAALEGSGIEQAREGVRLAELSYRAGKSSLVEYIDAQQAYAATQAELIAARQARAAARAVLARQAAAGGDVDHEQ